MSKSGLTLVLFFMILSHEVTAIPLGAFYQFGGSSDSLLHRNDDDTSPLIILPGFYFFGTYFTSIFVSNLYIYFT